MTKHKPSKGNSRVKPLSELQIALSKIATNHREQYARLTQDIMKVAEAPPPKPKLKLKAIPEDARIAFKLHLDEYGQVVFGNFRYRDLQRAAIMRGMSFDDLVNGDIYRLHKFIQDHKDVEPAIDKLDEFDEWRRKLLEEKHGKGEPFVRLGYIGKTDDEGNPLMVFKPKPKKPKKHIEKDSEMGGLWKGTKKHLTVQCKKDGLSLDKTISKVMEAFPDAKESSIKIWYKRSA